MDKLKNELAKKNGLSEERYVELVREKANVVYPNKADEISLLRKELAYLRSVIEKNLGIKLEETEFTSYNALIENFKTEARAEVE